jgi:hypothetical protein
MGEQSSKHGPVQDEQLAHDDQPQVDQVPSGDRRGLPPGMTERDVDERSEIARFLGISAFPGDRDSLVAAALEHQATDHVLAELRRLPAGETYRNVQEVVSALGYRGETHRT